MQHRDTHAHAFEQLGGYHQSEQLGLPQVNHGHVQQRPIARHLGLGHRIEKNHIPQPALRRQTDQGLLAGAIPQE